MQFKGTVHRYGRDIDTDVIIPARYLTTSEPSELAKHCLEDLDVEFVNNVKSGDIIVAEENFGCGSSREHAPIAIKAAGVDAVIAKSFARIFYRNSINTGLAILECPEAVDAIKNGDVVSVDTETGTITDETTGESFTAQPFPPFIADIIEQGGLLNRTRHVLGLAYLLSFALIFLKRLSGRFFHCGNIVCELFFAERGFHYDQDVQDLHVAR